MMMSFFMKYEYDANDYKFINEIDDVWMLWIMCEYPKWCGNCFESCMLIMWFIGIAYI
jgi:hypothetical protein